MDFIHYANGWLSLACAAGLSCVVLNRRIAEGLVVKVGLVLMILGLAFTGAMVLADLEIMRGMRNAGFTTRLGLLIVIVGYAFKVRRRQHPQRRSSDWITLDDDEQRQVAGGVKTR